MPNPAVLRWTRIALVCAGIACSSICGHVPAGAAELYGVQALGDRYVIRLLDTDNPGSVRELATIPNAPDEELRGLVQFGDHRLVLLRTSLAAGESARARLKVLGVPGQLVGSQELAVSGLEPFASLDHLLVGWGARYYGLVSHYLDTPPYQLVTFHLGSRGISILKSLDMPAQARYANLTQCPDGAIYATSLAPQQDTRLVKLDPESAQVTDLSPLTLNGRTLPNDLSGLACDPSGQLYALADPQRRGTASLFAVDAATGALRWVTDFAADKMTFVTGR